MKNQEHLERLVSRYLSNQATAAELEVFVHLHKQGVLDDILNASLDDQISGDVITKKSWYSKRLTHVAASVVILLMSSYLLYVNIHELQDLFNPVVMTKIVTGDREIKRITLSDGSVITLNQNSAIHFSEKWRIDKREVSLLKGEAYFEIQKTVDRQSFTVKTPERLDIRVLGTEFNVLCQNREVSVYLQKGKVQLNTGKNETVLAPGELAEFHSVDKQIDIQHVDGSKWLAWKDNLFVFEDANLKEIARVLQDYYGLQVLLPAKGIDHLRFTGKVSRTNMNTVIDVIAETLNLKSNRKGHVLTFQTLK